MSRKSTGFTLPELVVGMAIMSVLLVTIIGASVGWLTQYAVSSARQTMTIDMQGALSRMSDDIRQSRGVLVENNETDPNAPTSTGRWLTGTNQLILAKTPYNELGQGLYDIPNLFNGKPDSIVYYLQDDTLYRRVIPANYTGNVTKPLLTCPGGPATGGCPSDTKVISNITALEFTYYDSSNVAGAVPASAKSVQVAITTARQQTGQTVTVQDKTRVNPQQFTTFVPPPPDGDGGAPPGPLQTTAGVTAGPGGLQVDFSNIAGRDMSVKGRITMTNLSTINLNTYRLDVGNTGCGTRATFPVACTGQQPISNAFFSTVKATPVCAPGQTSTSGITGLQSCTLPTLTMPTFNKGAYTATKIPGPAGVTCSFFTPVTLSANTRIDGDVTGTNFCKLTITGNTYIKGNLNMSGFSTLQIANGVTTRPIIVVDRQVNFNFSSVKPNNLGVTPYIISFYAVNTTCSDNSSCATLTNPEIYDNVTSVNNAINITNYSDIKGALYAYFGTLSISTSSTLGALAGQKIVAGGISGVQLTEAKWPS